MSMLVRPVGEGEQRLLHLFTLAYSYKERRRISSFRLKTLFRVTLKSVTFYELTGEGAKAELKTLAQRLEQAGMTTELLESRIQPGLFLLVCRTVKHSAERVTPKDLPKGTKVWQFRRTD